MALVGMHGRWPRAAWTSSWGGSLELLQNTLSIERELEKEI